MKKEKKQIFSFKYTLVCAYVYVIFYFIFILTNIVYILKKNNDNKRHLCIYIHIFLNYNNILMLLSSFNVFCCCFFQIFQHDDDELRL